MTEPQILTELSDGIAVLTLNAPRTLNSINMAMFHAMWDHLTAWQADPAVRAVVVRGAGDRAFCAGGDVRAVVEKRGDEAFMHEVYRCEYVVDRLIHHYGKPYIPLMDGIVMGGGAGVSVHAYGRRIVTERTVFAMPETALGLFPDIAASHFLSRAPGEIGLYMGLTGARLGAADAIHAGVADHCVESARLDELVTALRADPDVDGVIARFRVGPGAPRLPDEREAIDRCFAADSLVGVIAKLEDEASDWAAETLARIRAMCPFSQAIAFKDIRMGAGRGIEDCLITDFRLAQRFMDRPDYFEGARALLIDKDNNARWDPDAIEKVDPAEVDSYFQPLGDRDLAFDKL